MDSVIKENEGLEDEDIIPSAEELDKMKSHREKEEKRLRELIDTITAKELINEEAAKELDPLDLLSDLRGDDDSTKVLGTVSEIDETPKKKETSIKESENIEVTKKDDKKLNTDTLTQTGTLTFTQSDFDDFNDLKEDMRFTKILIKVLIAIIVIVFIIGCIILANKIFHLGFF